MTNGRLVVLGSCGGWPQADRACSGFVIEHEGVRVVLDLGYGTLPRLFALTGSSVGEGIDAVVVTHGHPDHVVDLHGLFRARWFGQPNAPAVPLYAPEGVIAQIARLEDADAATVRRVFDWHPLPAGPYRIGPFRLDSWALPHYVPNAGVRVTAPGLVVAYSGDTGPDPALAELGRNADLYLLEATSRDQQSGVRWVPDVPQLHLSARQAGEAAAAAGAHRLMLTHFWPGNDREQSRAEAREVFRGEVLLADEGLEVPLPGLRGEGLWGSTTTPKG
jgi:ribonuclease BN (tRNA processing enzyme)